MSAQGHSRHSGVSRSAVAHTARAGRRTRTILGGSQQAARKKWDLEARIRLIHGLCILFLTYWLLIVAVEMTYTEREMVSEMDNDCDMGGSTEDPAIFSTLPPGDEGFDISHEGGEHEVFEELSHDLAEITGL